MNYKLRFHELAIDEWHKIDGSVKEPLKKKLAERLKSTHIHVWYPA
jgi:mRNA interferase RelE/StbE